jgi:hypothetical protein
MLSSPRKTRYTSRTGRSVSPAHPRVRGNTTRARVPFLLKGIVPGGDGRALTPWFTRQKHGRHYRYYLSMRENKEHAGASGFLRILADLRVFHPVAAKATNVSQPVHATRRAAAFARVLHRIIGGRS